MNSTTPITIAIPGEKRNEKQVKQFLLAQWLMSESDISQDIFPITWTNSRFVTLRVQKAIRSLESGIIDGVINGEDLIAERMIERCRSLIKEGSRITWYDYNDSFWSARWIAPDKRIVSSFVLDDEKPTKLNLLYRPEDGGKTLEEFSRDGDILTSYPRLTEMILAERFWVWNIGKMIATDGKIEAQLKLGMWKSAIDIVDTGNSARKNNLLIGETVFESFPIGIFLEKNIQENPAVKSLVDRLTEASNNAYYNSFNYRQQYPRG